MGKVEKRPTGYSERVSYRDATGKRRFHRITAPTLDDLAIAKARWMVERADANIEPSMQPLAAYLRAWHATLRRTTSTRRIYATIIEDIAKHPIGGKAISKLRRHDVQQWVNQLAERYEPATVRQRHACLRSGLNAAVRLELISRNPAMQIDLPPRSQSSWVVLDAAQVRALIRDNTDDPYHAAWVLAVTLGIRKGELLALRWSDIDLTRGELTVNRTVRRSEDQTWHIADMPKTTKSRRTLRLPLAAQLALKRHQTRQEARRAVAGRAWVSSGIVFDRGTGEPHPHPTVLQNCWATTRARLGIQCRLHDLRHTAISNMIAMGLPITTVASIAGHASATITLGTYGHIVSGMLDEAVRRMDVLYGGDGDDIKAVL